MSNHGPIADGQDGAAQATLSALIEKSAVQVVVGNVSTSDRIALLKSICEEADLAGRPELSGCIKHALEAASNKTDDSAVDVQLSDCVKQIQQLLSSANSEPSSCQSP